MKYSNVVLFEASWEVCNKVGGIHTVIRSKIARAQAQFGDNYFLIGPALNQNIEFEETDEPGWKGIRDRLAAKGLHFRLGRWTVPGRPRVILVEPGGRYNQEQLLFRLWEQFGVDSIAGGWDYVEPVLYSTAFGEVAATIADYLGTENGCHFVAQFHEWMTGAGLLYVKEKAPHVATVFTTHATVIGRAMMGAGQDIYTQLDTISPTEEARNHNVTAKHSLECVSARQADVFTTVSEITAREAYRFLGREPSVVTPNGLDIEAIPDLSSDRVPAREPRKRVLDYARRFLRRDLPEETRLAMISGRYEFTNKGIDVFLEALAAVRDAAGTDSAPLVAFLFVLGPHLEHRPEGEAPFSGRCPVCSHRLPNENTDPILNTCMRLGLANAPDSPVSVIFIPVYLSEGDGVLNMSYYDVLKAFDIGVFPSKYEPWGYTPLESAAFAVPTVTTDLAGFGIWARHYIESEDAPGVFVVERLGRTHEDTVARLSELLLDMATSWSDDILAANRAAARRLAEKASWTVFYQNYLEAYDLALAAAEKRVFRDEAIRSGELGHVLQPTESSQPHFRSFVVETQIPKPIAGLRDLAYNLWWSWQPAAQELFERMDPRLWDTVGHNPVRLLDEISAERLKELAKSSSYRRLYENVLSEFKAYMKAEAGPDLDRFRQTGAISPKRPVAYFSTEFGIHECLPIYSGGLGVLSGDHLKSASDLGIPLVAVGLFYRYGYFQQRIGPDGTQLAEYPVNDPAALPIRQVRDEASAPISITVGLPGRTLYACVWRVQVGRVPLYLLDTDLPANTAEDREITGRLYVADPRIRIEQEILLGIGGARLLRRLGIQPALFHINEGHSAFLILENIRAAMQKYGMNFEQARELVRSQTVFTTHTPVDAGNERFAPELVRHYFAHTMKEAGILPERFFELGRLPRGDQHQPFVMTILALKNAAYANAVSILHRRVSRKMWEEVWPGTPRSLVPIDAVTNGVHGATFIGPELRALLDTYLGMNWISADVIEEATWRRLEQVPNEMLWAARMEMKQRLIAFVKEKVAQTWAGSASTEISLEEVLSRIHSSALIIGFARRFAPYKRANLLFQDLERLARIVNNPRRPVQFIFAGKAHPNDQAGCDLVAEIVRYSRDPRFAGRIVFLEDYNLRVAKLMVQGVDVWLNTPRRPLEASGTSGQKAAINGVVNLSVADGWWCEGATGDNGWTIGLPPEDVDEDSVSNDFQEAAQLYALLEDAVIPAYYQRNTRGLPERWLGFVRRSMTTVAARFNSHRMLLDYWNRAYVPVAERGKRMLEDNARRARELADWKKSAAARFASIQILHIRTSGLVDGAVPAGKPFEIRVRLNLGDMAPDELRVDLVVGRADPKHRILDPEVVRLEPVQSNAADKGGVGRDQKIAVYGGTFTATSKGSYAYGIRIMPHHPDIERPEDMGLVIWA